MSSSTITSRKRVQGSLLSHILLFAAHLCIPTSLVVAQVSAPMELTEEREHPSKRLAHPSFVKHCQEEYWYSTTDEFSPFGSDEGFDLFNEFIEWRNKHKSEDVYNFFLGIVGRKYGNKPTRESMKPYIADMRKSMPELSDAEFEKILNQILEKDFSPYIRTTLISASFCQLYVDGSIDSKLLDLSLTALNDELNPVNLSKIIGDVEGYKGSLLKQRTVLESIRNSK